MNAIEGSDKTGDAQTSPFSPNTLVIHYNQNLTSLPPKNPISQVLEPIKIQIPMPFPYKKNNKVSWNYSYQVLPNNNHNSSMTIPNYGSASFVTNISGVSEITCSGHYFSAKELEKERVDELERQRKGKEKEVIEETIVKEGCKEPKAYKGSVLKEKAYELLKLIRQSDYKIIEQLNHTPT